MFMHVLFLLTFSFLFFNFIFSFIFYLFTFPFVVFCLFVCLFHVKILYVFLEFNNCVCKFYKSKNKNLLKKKKRYTHIPLGVIAAIKTVDMVWNDKDWWSNIIIHLGYFHAFMTFFGSNGKFMTGSGFEEVVYQAGLCTSESINGLLSA